jgi:tRNA pseudouridine synthase 9
MYSSSKNLNSHTSQARSYLLDSCFQDTFRVTLYYQAILAPSARVLEYISRKTPQTLAVMITAAPAAPVISPPAVFTPPPEVIATPADRWPRPYYFENGLRRVSPYHFTYKTNCKQRWRERELLDIFASEFRDRPLEYYVSCSLDRIQKMKLTKDQKDAIERGFVAVNGKPVPTSVIIKNGDVISHTLHRHEPPVTAEPIRIVHEDDDMIVINKPAGVPVHPAGRYNYNSIVEIMRAERGMGWNPLPCNRLDRLTSGIMFVGKYAKAAEALSEQIRSRTVKKEYVARVQGEFPEEEVTCEQPVLAISPKLGLNRVRANGKEAKTVFKRLAYYPSTSISPTSYKSRQEKNLDSLDEKRNRGYSVVRCLPLTGRTHQIRVHLQFLGHPISNDPIYCNTRVFGPSLGFNDDTGFADEDIISRLSRMGKDEVAEAVAYHDEMVDEYNKRKAEKMTGELCGICATPLYSDPGPHELGIYLHARRYACEDGKWSYETPLPAWALPPPGVIGPMEPTAETDPLALHKEP